MKLSRDRIASLMASWGEAWDRHDLDGVMALFHDEVVFDNWTTGRAEGKEGLRKAWGPWFENHGGFRFTPVDLFIDEEQQKVLYSWSLSWPSAEKGFAGLPEVRRGVDVIHFRDGLIVYKDTFSKTTLNIDGRKARLSARTS